MGSRERAKRVNNHWTFSDFRVVPPLNGAKEVTGGATAGGEGRVLLTPQRFPDGPNFKLSPLAKLSGPAPG